MNFEINYMRVLAQFIHDVYMKTNTRSSFLNRCIFYFCVNCRVFILFFADPLINHSIVEGKTIVLPFSHDLWVVQRRFPLYGWNMVRIMQLMCTKYPAAQIVDIGANIGDGVVMIRSVVNNPILAIEGSLFYYQLMQRNISLYENVYGCQCWLGEDDKELDYVYKADKGSGVLMTTDMSEKGSMFKLPTILHQHPDFNNIKFVKIDTDGFDCSIIKGMKALFLSHAPAVFFEYDPAFKQAHDPITPEIFEVFRSSGYVYFICYFNTGEYCISGDLTNTVLLHNLHERILVKGGSAYYDFCIFHEKDSVVAKEYTLT